VSKDDHEPEKELIWLRDFELVANLDVEDGMSAERPP